MHLVAHYEMYMGQNGPEMAQKWHFFKLSANFSHGYWRDIGIFFPSDCSRPVRAAGLYFLPSVAPSIQPTLFNDAFKVRFIFFQFSQLC